MMLRGSLVVHEADLEKLAKKAISDSGLRLSWHRDEELLAELVAFAWELSERHDERRHPGGFATGCYRLLRLRINDHVRRVEQRTRWSFSEEEVKRSNRRYDRVVEKDGKRTYIVEHKRPQVLSFDIPLGPNHDSTLGETVASFALDVAADSDEALSRALASRDSETGGPSDEERRTASRRAR